jgi:GT2 family glycosyltransferase
MGNNPALVSVTIITHDSEKSLVRCLDSVLAQDWPLLQVILVDNDSRDGTRSILSRYQDRIRVTLNAKNNGFAGGQNQAIRQSRGEWILALNPDVLLTPNFVSCLMEAANQDPAVGTVCGKLLRALPDLQIPTTAELDSTGMCFTPTFRHLDRGMHQPDSPQYSHAAYVFGATGAAAFYRRKMIEDIRVDGEFFDEDFFFSREDADVSWRAQLLGWKCLYTPRAVGYHVRRVFPGVRRLLPASINRHSVKNRFLMRIKNATPWLCIRNFVPVVIRDLGIFGYCLVRERGSLSGFWFVLRNWSRTVAKRRVIQSRRRVSEAYMEQWFRFHPVTLAAPAVGGEEMPVGEPAASPVSRPLVAVHARQASSSRLR